MYHLWLLCSVGNYFCDMLCSYGGRHLKKVNSDQPTDSGFVFFYNIQYLLFPNQEPTRSNESLHKREEHD